VTPEIPVIANEANSAPVIASGAKQSKDRGDCRIIPERLERVFTLPAKAANAQRSRSLDCFAPLAMMGVGVVARKAQINRGVPIAFMLLAALFVASAPAHAALRVCNKTRYLLNFAVGYPAGADFATEGWWTVTPNTCATPIKGPLKGRYVYLYATDIDANDVLKGSVSMCIDRRKFQIFGIADCWRRGLQAVNFAEVDTMSAPDWTAYLNDVGK
jgi:uncharacterized membrane protein